MTFFWAQVIGFIWLFFSISVFQFNKRDVMLYLLTIASFLFWIHFFLLWALTGAIMNFINILRGYIYLNNHKKWWNHKYWMYIFITIFIFTWFLTWKSWYSILPIIGMCTQAIAFWHQDTKKIRHIALISPPCWFIYNFIFLSYPWMMGEIVIFASTLLGIYRFEKKTKKIIF